VVEARLVKYPATVVFMNTRYMHLVWLGLVAAGCGAKTPMDEHAVDRPSVDPAPEVCDRVDNDLDGEVDEPWMDEMGRYIHDEHCGDCDTPCAPDAPEVLATSCQDVEGTPLCLATECAEGYAPSRTGGCVPMVDFLCLPCIDDFDCGTADGATCEPVGEELRCTISCRVPCPPGYDCIDGHCLPPSLSCWCGPGSGDFTVACTIFGPDGELECLGHARCHDGVQDDCEAYAEVCDELDNDCNGVVDDPYTDDRGVYTDIHNCGACGVDCSDAPDLTCGGDPFRPWCTLLCVDTLDGLDPGDEVDANLIYADGCECRVASLDDDAGPVPSEGPALDVNCDGADGVVEDSVYVAPDGDDTNPGSPNYPVATIAAAIEVAAASLETDFPRPHVFVAAGNYGEVLRVPEGVQVHGGYYRDFLRLDPEMYVTVVYASADGSGPGGAALVIEGARELPTGVEGLLIRGAGAPADTSAAYGVVLLDSTSAVTLRDLRVEAGDGAPGRHGTDGAAGISPARPAGDGALPRPAVEDRAHSCEWTDPVNTVAGGEGGASACDGTDVSGGRGGSADCPAFAESQAAGSSGNGFGGGDGGRGGVDSEGPIESGESCPDVVCCGLADFTVPGDMAYAGDGENGAPGEPGTAGTACIDPIGAFTGTSWAGGGASSGGRGTPGCGGGGGGAGGGAVMNWYDGYCEWADGLGGGGGGGGGGGCGGAGGTPGTSGGPSIGILVSYTTPGGSVDPPVLEDVTITAGIGGAGGRGGAGGDGGAGGPGGRGGDIPREDQVNPSLAGPTPGARGGAGGPGGPGGGGGGGCGGSSIGVLLWLNGARSSRPAIEAEYRAACTVTSTSPGEGGDGGGGPRAGDEGIDGASEDVLVR
jgi:hypothetical protein